MKLVFKRTHPASTYRLSSSGRRQEMTVDLSFVKASIGVGGGPGSQVEATEFSAEAPGTRLTVSVSPPSLCFTICENDKPGSTFPALAICEPALMLSAHLCSLSGSVGKMVKG